MRKFWLWLAVKPASALIYAVAHAPRPLRNLLGDVLGLLWFDVFRIRRRLVLENLTRAFPEWSDAKRRSVGRWSLRNMGRNLVEYAQLPYLDRDRDKDLFQIEGREHYEAARAQGRGVCFLTLHLGNGDFATAGLAIHGIPLHMISKEFKWAWLNQVWFGVRRRLGTKFIAPRNSSYHILKALKAGENVVFVMDQFMGPPIGVRTTFFGHETGTALGLAVMAERAGAPVLPVYTYRREDGLTVVRFEPSIPFESVGDRDQSLAHMTQVYNDHLESYVRLHPEQWMWVHKRWKPFRDRRQRNLMPHPV